MRPFCLGQILPGPPLGNPKSGRHEYRLLILQIIGEEYCYPSLICFFDVFYANFKDLPAFRRTPFMESENWWAWLESNQRPRPYQGRALTN